MDEKELMVGSLFEDFDQFRKATESCLLFQPFSSFCTVQGDRRTRRGEEVDGFPFETISRDTGRENEVSEQDDTESTMSTYSMDSTLQDLSLDSFGDLNGYSPIQRDRSLVVMSPRPLLRKPCGVKRKEEALLSSLTRDYFIRQGSRDETFEIMKRVKRCDTSQRQVDTTGDHLNRATRKHKEVASTKQKVTSSKYTGVCWNKHNRKWQAQIYIPRSETNSKPKYKYLGLFSDEKEAAQAYDDHWKQINATESSDGVNFPTR